MENRDELIEIFRGRALHPIDCAAIADFIIQDRKRIVEPLVYYRDGVVQSGDKWPQGMEDIVIDDAIKLAGLD